MISTVAQPVADPADLAYLLEWINVASRTGMQTLSWPLSYFPFPSDRTIKALGTHLKQPMADIDLLAPKLP